jgi:hypothetical protein
VGAALLGAFAIGAAAGALFATRAGPSDDVGAIADSGALLAPDRSSRSGAGERASESRRRGVAAIAGRRAAQRGTAKRADTGARSRRPRAAARARRADAAGGARRSNAVAGGARRSNAAAGRAGAGGSEDARLAGAVAPRDGRPAGAGLAEGAILPGAGAAGGPVEAPPAAGAVRSTPEPRKRHGEIYKVRAGDSLWPIAEEQLGTSSSHAQVARRVKRLGALNLPDRIASGDPDLIVAGERLRLR